MRLDCLVKTNCCVCGFTCAKGIDLNFVFKAMCRPVCPLYAYSYIFRYDQTYSDCYCTSKYTLMTLLFIFILNRKRNVLYKLFNSTVKRKK